MPSGCEIFRIPLLVWLIASCDESYIRIGRGVYISAWASTLLVQLHWAMRRPRFVGRVTRRSHVFRFIKSLTLGDGWVWKGKKDMEMTVSFIYDGKPCATVIDSKPQCAESLSLEESTPYVYDALKALGFNVKKSALLKNVLINSSNNTLFAIEEYNYTFPEIWN